MEDLKKELAKTKEINIELEFSNDKLKVEVQTLNQEIINQAAYLKKIEEINCSNGCSADIDNLNIINFLRLELSNKCFELEQLKVNQIGNKVLRIDQQSYDQSYLAMLEEDEKIKGASIEVKTLISELLSEIEDLKSRMADYDLRIVEEFCEKDKEILDLKLCVQNLELECENVINSKSPEENKSEDSKSKCSNEDEFEYHELPAYEKFAKLLNKKSVFIQKEIENLKSHANIETRVSIENSLFIKINDCTVNIENLDDYSKLISLAKEGNLKSKDIEKIIYCYQKIKYEMEQQILGLLKEKELMIKEAIEYNAKLKVESANYDSKLGQAVAEISNLKSELMYFRKRDSEKVDLKDESIYFYENKLKSANDDIEKLKIEVAELEKSHKNCETDKKLFSIEISKYKDKENECLQQILEARKNESQLRSVISQHEKSIKDLKQNLALKDSELCKLNAQVKNKNTEKVVHNYKDEYDKLLISYKQLLRMKDDEVEKISKCYKKRIESLEHELMKLPKSEKDNESPGIALSNLEEFDTSKLEELEAQLIKKTQENQILQKENDKLKADINQLSDYGKAAESKLKNILQRRRNDTIVKSNATTFNDMAKLNAEMKFYKEKVSILEQEKDSLSKLNSENEDRQKDRINILERELRHMVIELGSSSLENEEKIIKLQKKVNFCLKYHSNDNLSKKS